MARRWRDDEGIGLILVIGIGALVTGLVITAVAMATMALGQSRIRSDFELSLTAAEDGIDMTLARLQLAYDDTNLDYPVPGPQTPVINGSLCNGGGTIARVSGNEANQAKANLLALAAKPGCLETTKSGQFVVWKPPTATSGPYKGYGRVYAMGWSPAYGAKGAVQRTIKVEYIFLPYAPSHAILTSGSLDISASTTVSTATGYDPTLAGVHANGTITTNGNPAVAGQVSSTAGSSASSNRFTANVNGKVVTTPTVTIPKVNALSFYNHARNNDAYATTTAGWWKDLCWDGTKASIKPYGDQGPCSATTEYSGLTGVSYDSAKHLWTISSNASPGVYYANQANVDVGTGNGSFTNMTVVASSENPGDCATKKYGSIRWDHYELKAPGFNNLFLYADADLVTNANFTAGNKGVNGVGVISGMYVAGDQIQMETSSQGAVGSVLAADQCNPSPAADQFPSPITANQVKNPAVYFDPNAKSPFTTVINQTLWLEY